MIHKFKSLDHLFALDVESGSVVELDELSYTLLGEDGILEVSELPEEVKNKFSPEDITTARNELASLVENGLLYTEPETALGDYKHNRQVKALCLHIAHDCNLRCAYCFAGQGDFTRERLLMPEETAKKAIKFVAENSGNRHNIEIDFFGGEPLMNFEAVKNTVAYAREHEKEWDKHFNFTLTTNGLLLNEKTQEWLDENMDNIVLSVDGRPEVNDRMRKTVNGEGSYELIMNNIQEMAQRREGKKDYYVRATYTGNNLDFSEDVKHIYEKGIKSISAEPVVAEPGASYEILESDLDQILEEYERLAQYNLENDFQFFHFNINLDGGPCIYKRMSGCGAGVDYLAVTPEGDLYPCHQFVSDESFCLGNLDEGIIHPEILERFAGAGMENKQKCRQCWCRYFCGGGCHANAYNFNKDLTEPYDLACEMERKRVETAIALYALSSL